MSNIIECKKITKKYKNVVALNGVDFNIEPGKIVGLLGENGSGKTTLFNTIAGLTKKSSGEISVNNNSIGIETKKNISYLPSQDYLDKHMVIKKIIKQYEELFEDYDSKITKELLEEMNIDISTKLVNLSKGNQQKVKIAIALGRRVSLYIFDEPLTGIDVVSRSKIIKYILTNYNPKASVIIASHFISEVEKILDEYIIISEGVIIDRGDVENVRETTGTSLEEYYKQLLIKRSEK